MALGISPLVDFAFKLMLGNPEHADITIHFLNSVLINQPKIAHVQFLNPFLGKESDDDKLSVLDILATDEHGRQLNIEMQTSVPAWMPQRLAYYAASIYCGQLSEGKQYSDLRPAICICVLSQAMFATSKKLHLDFRLRESSADLTLTDDLQIHLLQLKHLQVTAEAVYDATPAERWCCFLKNAEQLTLSDIRRLFPEKEFQEAAGVLQMISKTTEQMIAYQARLKYQRDQYAMMEQARIEASKGREEAMAAGLAEGLAEGLQQGLQQGEEIGEARGLLMGRIMLLQEMLGLSVSTTPELAQHDLAQLATMAEQLQLQFRGRKA
jgi:predicted transposase/invertase (TIGR01784 family)